MGEDLTIRDLSFAYRRRPVLHDACLTVRAGSLTVLLGANGSGKSTLVKCLCGVLHPHQGEALYGSVNLLAVPPRRRARTLSYVPQTVPGEDSGLTVLETVMLGTPRGMRRAQAQEVAFSMLNQCGLSEYALRRTAHLSGGERQRVLIARGMAQDADFIVLDEPISSLDLRFQVEIMDILWGLAHHRGRGVLAVLHDVNLAAMYADEIILLKAGVVLGAGEPNSVLNADVLSDLYSTPVQVSAVGDMRHVLPVIKKGHSDE